MSSVRTPEQTEQELLCEELCLPSRNTTIDQITDELQQLYRMYVTEENAKQLAEHKRQEFKLRCRLECLETHFEQHGECHEPRKDSSGKITVVSLSGEISDTKEELVGVQSHIAEIEL
jgi:hypothetical protein